MKTRLILFGICLLSQLSQAQGDARLVRIESSLGFFTLNDQRVGEMSSEPAGTQDWGDWSSLPSYSACIVFYSYKKWEIGLDMAYQHSFINAASFRDENNLEWHEKVSTDCYTIMPRARLNWIRSSDGFFEMYSSLSMGLTFANTRHTIRTNENGIYPQPGGQICLMGMRFGKTLGGFMEMGVGTRGIFCLGISYRPARQ